MILQFCEPRNFSLCPRRLVGVYSGGLGVWFMTFCCCLVEFGSSCFNHAWIESRFVWFGPWYSTTFNKHPYIFGPGCWGFLNCKSLFVIINRDVQCCIYVPFNLSAHIYWSIFDIYLIVHANVTFAPFNYLKLIKKYELFLCCTL